MSRRRLVSCFGVSPATAENVRVVAELAAAGRLPHLVVDPVMVSSSGHRLLDADAEQAYLDELFPHAHVITPNQREAAALLGRPITGRAEQAAAAAELGTRTGVPWVIVVRYLRRILARPAAESPGP